MDAKYLIIGQDFKLQGQRKLITVSDLISYKNLDDFFMKEKNTRIPFTNLDDIDTIFYIQLNDYIEGYHSELLVDKLTMKKILRERAEAATETYVKAIQKGHVHDEAMEIGIHALFINLYFVTAELQHKLTRRIFYLQKKLNSKKKDRLLIRDKFFYPR